MQPGVAICTASVAIDHDLATRGLPLLVKSAAKYGFVAHHSAGGKEIGTVLRMPFLKGSFNLHNSV